MEKEMFEKEMLKKEKYETPVMDVVRFECEDVITASGDGDNTGGEAGISFNLFR